MNKTRVYITAFFLSFLFFIIWIRLFNIQILKKDEYIQFIQKQYYTKENILLPRGSILDRNGDIFAISVPAITLYAIPKYLTDKQKEELAKNLSVILRIPESRILKKLRKHRGYVILAENVDKKLKDKLLELRIKLEVWNFGIVESSKRFYPFGSLAGTTLGFVNRKTGIGMEGLEYKLNKKLGGGIGKILLMKDALGSPITIEKEEITKKQFNVELSIDKNIQFMAEKALKKLIQIRKPKEAAVLIVDPNTGDILAAATYPNYNPNKYWLYKNHKNIIFQNAYEPGSLSKPFVYALAYEKGILKKSYYCGDGKIKIGKRIIRDHKRFKNLSPEEIIIHSSNVGIIKIALELDKNELLEMFKNIGFGKSTKTFPGEASGIIRKPYGKAQIAYMSIGQSWIASPLQIAMAYSAIANGGYLLKPRLEKAFIDPETGEKEEVPIKVLRKVFEDDTVQKLKEILKLVVEEGTAKSGKSQYYTVAGKTGTAQKYDPKTRSLSKTKYYTWFAGFFPVEKPKYTIVVFANEPQQIYKWEHIGGGKVSSVVLKELIDQLMFYTKEKPDKKTTVK